MQSKFNEYFYYQNGQLFWKKQKGNKKPGELVGHLSQCGYVRAKLDGIDYQIHRVIWTMLVGPIPADQEIDHINHNKSDNRLENLRLTDRKVNAKNLPKKLSNTSGVTGVHWSARDSRWYAQIRVNSKRVHLDVFDNVSDAILARQEAEITYNFHRNHGK